MSRNAVLHRAQFVAWPGAILALAAGAGVSLLAAELLMSPPRRELRDMGVYLLLSGAATLAGGWLLLGTAGRVLRLSIRAKIVLGAVAGSAIGLANVVVIAQLMFLSTSHDLNVLLATIVFSGVITTGFGLWAASNVTSRIAAVRGGVGALSRGNYGHRVSVHGNDEVALVAREINELAERLEEASRQREALDRERRDLTAAISHDLRTPLASARAVVEALDDRVVTDPEEVDRYHGILRREIDRLSRMIDDLFELARVDAGQIQLERRPLVLYEIAADVVDAMQVQASHRGVMLSMLPGEIGPVQIPLDGARIERAIANLVRNALEHTPAGGRVDVAVTHSVGHAELRVSDTGSGVPGEDIERIWERFYRGDRSRTRDSATADGAGLGLAIVRSIVEGHGGDVAVESSSGAGSTFTVRLPLVARQN